MENVPINTFSFERSFPQMSMIYLFFFMVCDVEWLWASFCIKTQSGTSSGRTLRTIMQFLTVSQFILSDKLVLNQIANITEFMNFHLKAAGGSRLFARICAKTKNTADVRC